MLQGQSLISERAADAALTADQLNTLTDTCVVQRWSRAADAYGSQTTTWNNIVQLKLNGATTISCAVNRDTEGDEAEVADRLTQHNKYIVHMPAGVDIRSYDRIIWQGKTMNVNNVFEPVSIETLTVVYASVFT
jgi:hypothetical protein